MAQMEAENLMPKGSVVILVAAINCLILSTKKIVLIIKVQVIPILCCSAIDRESDNPFEFGQRRRTHNQGDMYQSFQNQEFRSMANGQFQSDAVRTHLASGGYEDYMGYSRQLVRGDGMSKSFMHNTQKFSSDQFRSPQAKGFNLMGTDSLNTPTDLNTYQRSRNTINNSPSTQQNSPKSQAYTGINQMLNDNQDQFRVKNNGLNGSRVIKKKINTTNLTENHSRQNSKIFTQDLRQKFTDDGYVLLEKDSSDINQSYAQNPRQDRFLSVNIEELSQPSLMSNRSWQFSESCKNSQKFNANNKLQLQQTIEELDSQMMMEEGGQARRPNRNRFDSMQHKNYQGSKSKQKQILQQDNIYSQMYGPSPDFDNDSQYHVYLKEQSVDFQLDFLDDETHQNLYNTSPFLNKDLSQSLNFDNSKILTESFSKQQNEKLRDKQASSPPSSSTPQPQLNIDTTNQSIVQQNQQQPSQLVETEILPRSNTDIRNSYLAKLTHKHILQLSPNKLKKQTLIIFDWDDTLFFTSAVKPENESDLKHIIKTYKNSLQMLDERVSELLERCITPQSQVAIVTNAKKSWVYLCSEKMMPKTFKIIQKSILVVSARDAFVGASVMNAKEWKQKTFTDLVVLNKYKQKFQVEQGLITNFIVVGDQYNEIQAGFDVSKQIERCLYKSVKLSEQPCISELMKQLKIIADKWDYIVNYHKCLEVELSRKQTTSTDLLRQSSMMKSNYLAHHSMSYGLQY
eukprot:403331679